MKKLAIIFASVFFAAIAGFVVSVVALGTDFNLDGLYYFGWDVSNELMQNEQKQDYSFADTVTNLNISVVNSDLHIKLTDTKTVNVTYKNCNRNTCSVNVENGTLNVREQTMFLFSFGFFMGRNTLEIELPEAEYNNVNIASTSGGGTFEDLICNTLNLSTTSGDFEISTFASKLAVASVSGNMKISNCTDKTCESFSLATTSGDYTIQNFRTSDGFKLNTVSGDVTLKGVSGKGKLEMTSGDVEIRYAEWTDDLEISTISGSVDIILPEGSGACVTANGLSGNCEVNLGGTDVEVKKGSTSTIGGANVHNINVSMTSGDISISD